MRRLAMLGGFLAGVGVLAWHLLKHHNLMYSAVVAGAVMFIVGIILSIAFRGIQRVLIHHLLEQQRAIDQTRQKAGANGPNSS